VVPLAEAVRISERHFSASRMMKNKTSKNLGGGQDDMIHVMVIRLNRSYQAILGLIWGFEY